jgi:hypothetical protein
MHHRRLELAFDDIVSRSKTLGQIATGELEMIGDVGLLVGAILLVAQIIVEDRGIRSHRGVDGHHGRERFVVHFDQRGRLFGRMSIAGSDRGYRMTFIENLLARHDVHREKTRVHGTAFAAFLAFAGNIWKVGAGHYRSYARMLESFFAIDRPDTRVGMRAAQYLPVKHPGEAVVRTVARTPGHFVDSIVADRTRPDHTELLVTVVFSHVHNSLKKQNGRERRLERGTSPTAPRRQQAT